MKFFVALFILSQVVLFCVAEDVAAPVDTVAVPAADDTPAAPASCVFPFTYKEIEYTECTTVDSWVGPWCATVADYGAEDDVNFKYCSAKDMGIETLPIDLSSSATGDSTPAEPSEPAEPDCVFPFTYAGVTYSQCTTDDSVTGRPWCSTAAVYTADDWKFCSVEETVAPCVLPFTYEDVVYTSCAKTYFGSTWCSITDNYPEDGEWRWCTAADELVIVSQTEPKCVLPFTYKDIEYTECTDVDSWSGTWCATTDDFTANPNQWMYCEK